MSTPTNFTRVKSFDRTVTLELSWDYDSEKAKVSIDIAVPSGKKVNWFTPVTDTTTDPQSITHRFSYVDLVEGESYNLVEPKDFEEVIPFTIVVYRDGDTTTSPKESQAKATALL